MKWTDDEVQIYITGGRRRGRKKNKKRMADTLVELNVGHIPKHICEQK